jgi:hypothetical protein
MPAHLTPALTGMIRAAINWLERPQPPDCHMQHHGFGLGRTGPGDDELTLNICPRGYDGHPVLSAERCRPRRPHPLADIENPLVPAEVDAIRDAITQAGSGVALEWNGPPAITVSFALTTTAHPDLLAAVRRYHAGCPDHPTASVFCACDAWRAGFGRALRPALTAPSKEADRG